MRAWLKSCTENHLQCRIQSRGKSLPTRLICLSETSGGGIQLKLVLVEEKHGQPVQYAALSYCWGGNQALTLCKANIGALSHNIPVDTLPPTLCDAVKVCRGLAIQHLWVDALCIIQDDDTSKMGEIAKMGSIYKGALVTISASSASNTNAGFLKEREPPFDPSRVVRLPFYHEQGEESEYFVTFTTVHHPRDPLDVRGWTLQEHLLSTRLLVFKAHQLEWKCQELDKIDGYRQGTFPFFSVTMPPAPPHKSSQSWPEWRRNALKTYEEIVGDYTTRKLTFEDDRPLAMIGIAEEFARMLGDQYVAGHWASALPLSLLWFKGDKHVFQHTGNYKGPTWSWASSGRAVTIEPFLARTDGHLSDCVVKCRVAEIQPKLLVADAPYGAFIQGTSLVLEGRLLQNAYVPPTYGPETVNIEGTDRQCSIRGAVKFDESEEEFHREGLKGRCPALLEFCTMPGPDTWKEIHGLVLDPVAGKDLTFTRNTMFRIMHEVENLRDDEYDKASGAWFTAELERRNPFNGAPVVRVELL